MSKEEAWEFAKKCVDRYHLEFISGDPQADKRSVDRCIAEAIYFTLTEQGYAGIKGFDIGSAPNE